MAPSKKKKKAVANPARGFSTVSQPSKSKNPVDTSFVPEDKLNDEFTDTVARALASASSSQVPSEQDNSNLKGMSPEELELHLEDAELQSILESHSVRCKQEATRQVSRLETERRQLRSQAHRLSVANWLSDEIVDEVLHKASIDDLPLCNIIVQDFIDDTALLLKLWTLEIVLETLHFPNIEAAIRYLIEAELQHKKFKPSTIDYIWGLSEVLEWYAVDTQRHALPDYDRGIVCNVDDKTEDTHESHNNKSIDATQSQSYSDSTTTSVSNNVAPREEEESGDIDSLTSLSSTDSEDNDPSSLVTTYLSLQRLIFRIEQRMIHNPMSPRLREQNERLRKRIETVQRDVLFDRDTADTIWQRDLQKLKVEASRIKETKENRPERPKQSPELNDSDDMDDNLISGIFDSADNEIDSRPTIASQAHIQVLDFGKWSGIPPRKILEDGCRNLEQIRVLKFKTTSATSYAVRQKLEITEPSHKGMDIHALSVLSKQLTQDRQGGLFTLEMSSIAAVDSVQAESYLSTTMLFLIAQSGYIDHKHSNRLPSTWKIVYNDLRQARQALVNDADKEALNRLRKAIRDAQDRLGPTDRPSSITTTTLDPISDPAFRAAREYSTFSGDEAQMQWQSRVSSPSYQTMLKARRQLPVYSQRDVILQSIRQNQSVIICADTGAGKSTQIPSFLLEHELSSGRDCRILVTQPRRISAVTLAGRVSQELGEGRKDIGTERSLIGYAIRLETKTSRSTRITFATTGVLLRMIEASPQLNDIDYLILDEVHERTMDLDLLFIALKKLQQRRRDFKVVLMSATVNAHKFSRYFDNAPVLEIPGRTFPVDTRYLEDAMEEITDFESSHIGATGTVDEYNDSDEPGSNESGLVGLESYSLKTRSQLSQISEYHIDYEMIASLAEVIATKSKYLQYSTAILIFLPGIAEIRRLHNILLARDTFASKWVVHLLHSSFSTEDLEHAFSIPPSGYRKIVIATNIAETGITIPDVTAVIDTCKEKVMRFDERRQLSRLTEGFISRSSARQRRGRAARVRDGLCFHLVTRHRFENLMPEQHVPEMLRLSLQDPILRIKIWNLGSIEETLSAAIDPPNVKNVRRAVDKLKDAGALNVTEDLTDLGKIIARLPLEVVLSKLAVYGIVFRCLDAILTIIAALSSKSPFISGKGTQQPDPRLAFVRGDSDLISTLNAYQSWRKAKSANQSHQFCRKNNLSDQNFSAIEDQKVQLLVYLVDAGLLQFSREEKVALNDCRLSANRKAFLCVPARYNTNDNDWMVNCAVATAFHPRIIMREGRRWRNVYTNQHVNLASSSVNRATDRPPPWLCFYETVQARSGSLNVLETSKVSERLLALSLGSAEIKFFSGVIVLDSGKIRLSLPRWKQVAAIKAIRESLAGVLDRCWKAPGLWMSPSDQQWIMLFAGLVAGGNAKTS